jgi:hypothetical protein
MAEGVCSTMIKSNPVIRVANETVNRIGANGHIMGCKAAHKNRLIGRVWPLVAQVISNCLAGRDWQRQDILAA